MIRKSTCVFVSLKKGESVVVYEDTVFYTEPDSDAFRTFAMILSIIYALLKFCLVLWETLQFEFISL